MSERKNSAGIGRTRGLHAQLRATLRRFSARPPIPARRAAQGLYDPALDKDSCGVGFIADIKGRKSHQIVEDALHILLNLEHRGAVGADPRAGDGAGILVQIPHKFFAKEGRRSSASRCRSPANTPSAICSCRATPNWRADHPQDLRGGDRARRPDAARLARRADRQFDARRIGEADRAGAHAGVHRPRQEDQVRGRVRAPALHPAQVDLERDLPAARAAASRAITRCRSPAAR